MRLLKTNPVLSIANSFFVDSPQPANISYRWNFGSLLGLSLILQIITGVLLARHYCSDTSLAFLSVEHIVRDVNYGWLLRYAHANGASFFFIVVYLHIGRGLYYGSYRGSRQRAWNVGVVILILRIGTAFRGYTLPYGQRSHWGSVVIVSLASVIPFIGQSVVEFVWGGFSVSNPTIRRFFSLHYLLPFILAALAAVHLVTLHDEGSSNPLGISSNTRRIPFYPYFVWKDLVTVVLFLLGLSFFVFYFPNYLGHPDNYRPANPRATPASIVPEWYLLPYYEILRSIPNKVLGVVARLGSRLILRALPYLDRSVVRTPFRPLSKILFWSFVGNFLVLMKYGAAHVEEPFVTIGQYCTRFYFSWFLILVPAITLTENTLFDLRLWSSPLSFVPFSLSPAIQLTPSYSGSGSSGLLLHTGAHLAQAIGD